MLGTPEAMAASSTGTVLGRCLECQGRRVACRQTSRILRPEQGRTRPESQCPLSTEPGLTKIPIRQWRYRGHPRLEAGVGFIPTAFGLRNTQGRRPKRSTT